MVWGVIEDQVIGLVMCSVCFGHSMHEVLFYPIKMAYGNAENPVYDVVWSFNSWQLAIVWFPFSSIT